MSIPHALPQNTHQGFSLVEMAIVLVIVALLMAGLLPTISSQIEQQRRNETRKYMEEVRNALIGYAVTYNYLPCPDTDGDGSANTPCQAAVTQVGTLPYKDLGVADRDGFNTVLIYGVNRKFADTATRFTLNDTGSIQVCSTQPCAPASTIQTSTAPAIIVSRGANSALAPSIDEGENTNNDAVFVSHDAASDFDDLVIWLSPNALFNRMVAAGKLP
jgi:prepilin-type N-terminal cleavage/methylation domain-containing protein